jgi:hypothetical protein
MKHQAAQFLNERQSPPGALRHGSEIRGDNAQFLFGGADGMAHIASGTFLNASNR